VALARGIENYERGWAAIADVGGTEFQIRHGIGQRYAFGRTRLRAVTWVEGERFSIRTCPRSGHGSRRSFSSSGWATSIRRSSPTRTAPCETLCGRCRSSTGTWTRCRGGLSERRSVWSTATARMRRRSGPTTPPPTSFSGASTTSQGSGRRKRRWRSRSWSGTSACACVTWSAAISPTTFTSGVSSFGPGWRIVTVGQALGQPRRVHRQRPGPGGQQPERGIDSVESIQRPGRVPASGGACRGGRGGVVIHAGLQVSRADRNGAPSSQPPSTWRRPPISPASSPRCTWCRPVVYLAWTRRVPAEEPGQAGPARQVPRCRGSAGQFRSWPASLGPPYGGSAAGTQQAHVIW
jgi:hypothetical protein